MSESSNDIYKLKFPYEAPRGVKMSDVIKQLALLCDLECSIETSKGWFEESGAVVCKGTYNNIMKFEEKMLNYASKYNNDYG